MTDVAKDEAELVERAAKALHYDYCDYSRSTLKWCNVSVLIGKTLTSVTHNKDSDSVHFVTEDDKQYVMIHLRDCCEDVYLADTTGDLNDLVGAPIFTAEHRANSEDKPLFKYDISHTWTFYELATIKGSVTLRWYGSSNGYYSECVDFMEVV